jgi:prepilin-type N-terminal cleavage/methylation domain-containing protein
MKKALLKKIKNKQLGFTLLELLVVIVIIGILSTIGLVSFRTAQMKSRDSIRKQDLHQISQALELYYHDRGEFPASTIDGLIFGCGLSEYSLTPCDWGSPFELGVNMYMAQIPEDPRAPATWYFYDSDGSSYSIYAILENEKDPQIMSGLGEDCRSGVECNYASRSTNLAP